MKPKDKLRKEALKLVPEYFAQAREVFAKDKKKANLYVHKARNLAMKYNISLPRSLHRQFCKHCHAFLMPGVNCRIRTREGKVIYYCLDCKHYMRFMMKQKK